MKCNSCNKEIPGWARETCPYCGTPIRSKKNTVLPYLVIVIFVVLVIGIGYMYVMVWSPGPSIGAVSHFDTPPPTVPTPPAGTISVSGVRQGPNIVVTVMGGSGLAEADNLTVSLNGVVQPQKIAASAGSSVKIVSAADRGSEQLLVVANYKNGAKMVVLNQMV